MKFNIPKLPKRPSLPPGLVKFLVIIAVGALALNCVALFSEFPINGNPFQWLQAQEFYKASRTAVKQSDFQKAQRQLKQAVQIYDRSSRFHIALGECDLRLHDYQGAKDNFEKATKMSPTDVSSWKKLSRAWALIGDREQSMAAIRRALELSPSDPGANAQYGLLLQVNGQEKEAAKVFSDSRTLDRDTGEYWWLAGQYFKLLGKPQESEAAFRQAAGKEPAEPEYAEWLGLCLLSLDKSSEAQKFLRQACELNPSDAEYWAALAEAQSAEGSVDHAKQSLKRALAIEPNNMYWKKIYGTMLEHDGQFSDAEKQFEEVLKQEDDALALKYYLNCLLAQGKFQKAEDILQARLKNDKTNSDYDDWICLGDTFAAQGNSEKAKDSFNIALAIKSIDPAARESVRERLASFSAKKAQGGGSASGAPSPQATN
ncbi:MAG TPA: tetratricopeptide repeat protein [Candidatus Obscuribacterales bacterium]